MDKSLLESVQTSADEKRLDIINKIGIFELRGLARELGVPSPTTRKRDELVKAILDRISSGAKTPSENKNKKGRPCKAINNLDKIMDVLNNSEESSLKIPANNLRPYDEVITFAQTIPSFSTLIEEEIGEFEGVLQISKKVGLLTDIKSSFKVYISLEFVKRYSLVAGDYLIVLASKLNSSEDYIVSEVEKINNIEAEQYIPPVPSQKSPVISFESMPFGDFQIFKGRRNVVYYKDHVFEDNRLSTFIDSLVEKDFKVVVLSLNTNFENQILLSNTNGIIPLITTFGSNPYSGLERTVDAIALTNRLSELGENVVLIVFDIIEVVNALDLCFEEKTRVMGHSGDAIAIAQKLLSVGRAFSDGSSATLLTTYTKYTKDDLFLNNSVFKVSNVFKD